MTTRPPYVTAWTGEQGYEVRISKLLGGRPGLFRARGKPGDGAPEWGIMSEERQRECVLRRRCQVCHRPLRGAGYNLVATRPIHGYPSTNEPLTCERCVPTVLRYCPGVRRHIGDGVALLARVREFGVALTPLRPVAGGNEELNGALAAWRGEPPIGFCQVLIRRFEPVDLDQLEALG